MILFFNFKPIFNLVTYKNYTDSCDSVYLCDYRLNLVCSSGSGTGCSCPNTLGASKCDCNQTQYWTGSKCTDRVTYNAACNNTYQCLANIGLTCSTGTNKCACALTTTYWDTTACSNLRLFYKIFIPL